jgi:hypothetical protein
MGSKLAGKPISVQSLVPRRALYRVGGQNQRTADKPACPQESLTASFHQYTKTLRLIRRINAPPSRGVPH